MDEGIALVDAVRARHDGVRRNPWNEVECGNHYARSMSSWALLLALTGMRADIAKDELSFAPVSEVLSKDETFKTFWSNGCAWGVYQQSWDADAQAWQSETTVFGGELDNQVVPS